MDDGALDIISLSLSSILFWVLKSGFSIPHQAWRCEGLYFLEELNFLTVSFSACSVTQVERL